MARKRIPRSLTQLPDGSALSNAEHKRARLIEVLRGLAIRNQQDQPKSFYSMRDIRTQFRLPLSMVAEAYRQLEEEGILSRVRGSKTTLEGLHYDRRISVRGFVGLPASEPAFVTLQEYRMFFKRMKRELRLRGFAAAQVFITPAELKTAELSKRLNGYQVDTIIWFAPPSAAREMVARFSDLGIRVLGVSDGQEGAIPCRYKIHRETAIRHILSEWKTQHSVEKITLAECREYRSPANDSILQVSCEEMQIQYSVTNFVNQRPEGFIRELQKSKTDAVVFPSSKLAAFLCFRSPEAITDLLTNRRVALIDGPVNMPFAKIPDARVDLITVNWQLVAEAIVDDLITQEAFKRLGPTIFEAEPYLRVQLNEFVQNI